ncbi:MAG: UDP-N-acetylmuramoyl-L-alanyl-D-glutamate--2,6-diaminopimelate ligase [Ilumatobacteraceae bacterium]
MVSAAVQLGTLADALLARSVRIVGDPLTSVVGVTHDSRSVEPGMLFACLRGEHHDGHTHGAAAVAAGAVAMLVDHPVALEVPQIVVDDTRQALGPVAAVAHGHPSRDLLLVGITGTNGKTTTAHLLAAILRASGRSTEIIGTLTGTHTTPEAPELQRRLAEARAEGRQAVAMEVSSHALALHRVDGTRFGAAVFTNLGNDHLDLHGTPEEYFRAKARLFTPELTDVGITNVDDPHGRLLLDAASIEMEGYSRDDATDVEVSADRHAMTWRGRRIEVPLGGSFNLMNTVAAATVAATMGIEPDDIVAGLAGAGPVPGRFERVIGPAGAPTVVVDYAHTPDGLDEVLRAARAVAAGRVVVVFGCGGDRDHRKRPQMGEVATRLADRVVVTSDNPRSEPPDAIISAVLAGIDDAARAAKVDVEPDRAAAIALAIDAAGAGDIVVVAGKGHETAQTTADRVVPFDDRVVARQLLERAR